MLDIAIGDATAWITTVGLVSLRVAALLLLTPILYAVPIPPTVRLLLCVGLGITLGTGLPHPAAGTAGVGGLVTAAISEAALGATLALGVHLAFSAFSVAGRILDIQIGFGAAQVMDPITRRSQPIVTSILALSGALLFLLTNGHHILLRGIAFTLERYPVGAAWPPANAIGPIVRQVSITFALGLSLAAPVVLCLLLAEAALGVISRNLPQMNMFALGISAKIVIGLFAMAVWWAGLGTVFERIYGTIFDTWDRILVSGSGIGGAGRAC